MLVLHSRQLVWYGAVHIITCIHNIHIYIYTHVYSLVLKDDVKYILYTVEYLALNIEQAEGSQKRSPRYAFGIGTSVAVFVFSNLAPLQGAGKVL